MKTWNDFIKPIVVLCVICLVTSVLLAAANMVTAPIIEENNIRIANETRAALLPQASSFTQLETTVEGVTELYKADNDTGFVVTASAKGYGGQVPVMVSIDMEGNLVAVKFLDNAETPGLGQKVKEDGFQNQFAGKKAEEMTLSDIDAISGATISSSAGVKAINCAILAFQEANGVVKEELMPEQVREQLLPDAGTLTAVSVEADGIVEAYQGENYGVIVYAESAGFYAKPIIAAVAMDDEGVITGVWVDASNETEDVGTQVATEKFTQQFIGKTGTDGVDAIAGATVSSNAALDAVQKAIAAFDTVKGA